MPARTDTPRSRSWLLPVLVVIVTLGLMAVAIGTGGGQDDAPPQTGPTQPAEGEGTDPADGEASDGPAGEVAEDTTTSLDVERRDPQDPLAAGPVDAPVVLVAYSDYQCPFCAAWVDQTQPTVMEYVESGDLRIEWRDVNVYGEDSRRGARAAYAAGLQDAFWEYHDDLFADGERPTTAELGEEALVERAGALGLDVDRFRSDLGSAEVARAVQVNEDEGMAVGAFSTPSFLVGGTPVVGAQPAEVFVDAIESALARAEG